MFTHSLVSKDTAIAVDHLQNYIQNNDMLIRQFQVSLEVCIYLSIVSSVQLLPEPDHGGSGSLSHNTTHN